jgi:uncharacterized protein
MHHQINYIEFKVKNMQQTKAFYSQAFGWNFNDYSPTYVGIRGGADEVGGFFCDPEFTPGQGAVLVVLYSDDLDLSLQAIQKAGGTITVDPFEFPGGKRFHFLDPNGIELAVWSKK